MFPDMLTPFFYLPMSIRPSQLGLRKTAPSKKLRNLMSASLVPFPGGAESYGRFHLPSELAA
jgi:hypothetical protein